MIPRASKARGADGRLPSSTIASGCSRSRRCAASSRVEAKQRGYFVVGRLAKDMRAPAKRRRGLSRRADRMAGVELTITKGALAVFPGLPPRNGAERQQEAAGRKQIGALETGAGLQRVIKRRVMIKRRRVSAHIARSQKHPGFRRMQIAARGIVAQRPGRSLDALPGAEAEREFEKQTQSVAIELRRDGRWTWKRRRVGAIVKWKHDTRTSREGAIGRGLRSPVEKGWTERIAIRRVFGALVIASDVAWEPIGLVDCHTDCHMRPRLNDSPLPPTPAARRAVSASARNGRGN